MGKIDIEIGAIAAIWVRNWLLFKRYWKPTSFSAITEPTVFLLALGLGLGAFITPLDGISYVQFVGTGSVASAALFASVFPGMFNTFVARVFQRSYEGILATPISVREVVVGEATWIGFKAGIYACSPIVITVIFFGLAVNPAMLIIPLVALITGLGFAFFGIWISGVVRNIESFQYVTSALVTPLFLVSGTFFPLNNLPTWALTIAQINPLYHCVQLVRDASFTGLGWADLGHAAFLVGFAVVMAAVAIPRMRSRLIE
jgi:lipooligosaccharide transport system permease protein